MGRARCPGIGTDTSAVITADSLTVLARIIHADVTVVATLESGKAFADLKPRDDAVGISSDHMLVGLEEEEIDHKNGNCYAREP